MNDEYLDVEKVDIPEKENVEYEPKYVSRDIQSVPDYLRVITDILSDRYFISKWNVKITNFENLFTNPDGIPLNDLLRHGIFFRGESMHHDYQLPGLFRSIELIEHEDNLVNDNITNSASELENKTMFDKLTLMQHYGSSTRILDITSNALIALYFAVSGDLNEDGFIYLISGYKGENFKDNIEIKTPDMEEVIVKSVLSRLSFKSKKLLSYLFSNSKDEYKDIKIKFEELKKQPLTFDYNILEIEKTINHLYLLVEEELNVSNVTIPISYLFGYDIVQPYQIDNRVARQSSLFMIFGLQDFLSAKKELIRVLNEDTKLKKLKEKEKEAEENQSVEIGGEADQIRYQIKQLEKQLFKETYERIIQGNISHQIYNLGIMYSKGPSANVARVKIKSSYKKQILDELNMLGINGGTVYPDMTNKIKYIKQKYNYVEFSSDDLN